MFNVSLVFELMMAAVKSEVSVVLGVQWGDEGKGKLVDILAQDADIVARCQVQYCKCLFFCCLGIS